MVAGLDYFKVGKDLITRDSIINGSATGAAARMDMYALAGIFVPASMVGTSITFQVSFDGVTYYDLKDYTGAAITVTIGATAAYYSMRALLPLGCAFVKPVSSASETSKTVTFVGQRVVD